MNAIQETPPVPASDPAMKWIAGCGFGCVGVILVLVVATVAFVSWMGREGPSRPEEVLADGNESMAFTVDLRPEDPAVLELLTGFQESAIRVQDARSVVKLPPFFESLRREDVRRNLPFRIDMVRWSAEGEAPADWIARVTVGSGAWKARFTMRLVSWMASRSGAARRETVDGVEILVIGGEEQPFATATVSNRVLLSRDPATLRRALQGDGGPAADRVALLEEVRIDGEDGRGYLRPGGDPVLDLAAASFDVASKDALRFRAAVRAKEPPEDPKAAAQAIEERVVTFLGFNDLRVVREAEPYWLDPKTLVLEGRVEGIAGLLGSLFTVTAEEPATP